MNYLTENELKKIISKNIILLMRKNNVSEYDIVNRTKISQSAFNRIKNGLVIPNIYQSYLIANFFSISLNELIDHEYHYDRYMPAIKIKSIIEKNQDIDVVGFIEKDLPNSNYKNSFLLDLTSFNSKSKFLESSDAILIEKYNTKKKYDKDAIFIVLKNEKILLVKQTKKGIVAIDNLYQKIDLNENEILGTLVKVYYKILKEKKIIENLKERSKEYIDNFYSDNKLKKIKPS